MSVVRFEVRDVEMMPETKETAVLYVSNQIGLAIHLCAGGCGTDVVMRFRPMFDGDRRWWTMTRDGDAITFAPSILQGGCSHHYFIENNVVRWA